MSDGKSVPSDTVVPSPNPSPIDPKASDKAFKWLYTGVFAVVVIAILFKIDSAVYPDKQINVCNSWWCFAYGLGPVITDITDFVTNLISTPKPVNHMEMAMYLMVSTIMVYHCFSRGCSWTGYVLSFIPATFQASMVVLTYHLPDWTILTNIFGKGYAFDNAIGSWLVSYRAAWVFSWTGILWLISCNVNRAGAGPVELTVADVASAFANKHACKVVETSSNFFASGTLPDADAASSTNMSPRVYPKVSPFVAPPPYAPVQQRAIAQQQQQQSGLITSDFEQFVTNAFPHTDKDFLRHFRGEKTGIDSDVYTYFLTRGTEYARQVNRPQYVPVIKQAITY